MIYKTSIFNYSFEDENNLLIINFKKGLSSFHVISDNDIETVESYLKLSRHNIDNPNDIENKLIEGGFLVPEDMDENAEIEINRFFN